MYNGSDKLFLFRGFMKGLTFCGSTLLLTVGVCEETMGLVIRNESDSNQDGGVLVERKVRADRPSLFKVLLLNDDFTPMDFVIEVLESVFRQDHTTATRIMLDVHRKGSGVCGVYPYEVAETKVARVQKMSNDSGYPLQCVMEKA